MLAAHLQGLNYVAAVLLNVLEHDDEAAFYMLASIVESRLYSGVYEANLWGCQVEMKTLGRLLEARRPALAQHLAHIGCDISLLATDW